MANKKLGYFILLTLLLVLPTFLTLVSAVEVSEASWPDWGGFEKVCRYLFGPDVSVGNDALSAAIITIALWILVFVTFSDIISTFSTFSKPISWIIGGLIAIIAANLGWSLKFLAWLTGAFAV